MTDDRPILRVTGLRKHFPVTKGILRSRAIGTVRAVDGLDFAIREGETFALVGESGCGKTTLSKLLLRIERPTDGVIEFEGVDINRMSSAQTRRYRSAVQPVFQDPYASLSPRMQVWEIVTEPLIINEGITGSQARARAAELLETVGLSPRSLRLYPHQFSGGQRQRIAIARALSSQPRVLVLDEPVSALDVSIRAQIMNLLRDLHQRFNLTLFIIAHDLATVRYLSDTVAVMYLGQIVEMGPSDEVYGNARHPYTRALMASALSANPDSATRQEPPAGEVPSPLNPPPGCHFHPRCPFAMAVCSVTPPDPVRVASAHTVACHLYPADE